MRGIAAKSPWKRYCLQIELSNTPLDSLATCVCRRRLGNATANNARSAQKRNPLSPSLCVNAFSKLQNGMTSVAAKLLVNKKVCHHF